LKNVCELFYLLSFEIESKKLLIIITDPKEKERKEKTKGQISQQKIICVFL
jgi:hypothetical protein